MVRMIGIDLINFHANLNGMFYGEKRKILLDNMVKSLREIVRYAEKRKIRVMLENVPLSNGIHDVVEFKYIIDNVPSLLVHLDIPHAFTSGGMKSVLDYINRFRDKIIHIHWHDNHGRKDEHLPIGEGLIEHEKAVRALKDIGYYRTITLEVFTSSKCYPRGMDNIMQRRESIKSQNGDNLNLSQTLGCSHLDFRNCYPIVKWAGGKSQILYELDSMIPSEFNRYFEPFLGGGAMFFHLISDRNMRFSAYLSDINEELITAYKVVKNNVSELIQILKRHGREYNRNPSKYYYKLRDEIKPVTDIDKTARFISLNKTCFNGLYRVNRNGIFNVPMGRYKNPLICDTDNLENVSKSTQTF